MTLGSTRKLKVQNCWSVLNNFSCVLGLEAGWRLMRKEMQRLMKPSESVSSSTPKRRMRFFLCRGHRGRDLRGFLLVIVS